MSDEIRKAKDSGTSLGELMVLASSKNELVRGAVVENESCTKSILDILKNDPSEFVQDRLSVRLSRFQNLYTIYFKEILVADAEYVLSLRLDPKNSQYLSATSSDINKQVEYVRIHQSVYRPELESFYFIARRLDSDVRCGTVKIYNIVGDSFEWGGWILDENKTRYAAVETAIFVYEYGFKTLGCSTSRFEVYKNNPKVISFHEKSGAKIIGTDENSIYFEINRDQALFFSHQWRENIKAKYLM